MILEESCKKITKFFGMVLCAVYIFCITGCSKEIIESDHSVKNDLVHTEESNEVTELKVFINDTEIPVIWEYNDTVRELFDETANGDIVVAMSMYGGNEQVGPLGRVYTRNDIQTTTHAGDIVLYNGNQIVLFYGSNSWPYTRLGEMDLSEDDTMQLLSNGDITLTLKR